MSRDIISLGYLASTGCVHICTVDEKMCTILRLTNEKLTSKH